MIECGGVAFDEQRLQEIDEGQVMVSVERSDIQRIRLRSGLISPHPILQMILAGPFLAIGLIPIVHFIHWAVRGGAFYRATVFAAPVLVIGVMLLLGAFRRGRFLEVETNRGRKRFAFRRRTDPTAISHFASGIETAYNIAVEREERE